MTLSQSANNSGKLEHEVMKFLRQLSILDSNDEFVSHMTATSPIANIYCSVDELSNLELQREACIIFWHTPQLQKCKLTLYFLTHVPPNLNPET
jgi:hypothetical protein